MGLFEQRILAEALRTIEGDQPVLCTSVPAEQSTNFEQAVLQRAENVNAELNISPLLLHFKRLTSHLFGLFSLLLLALGASTVQQLFFTKPGGEINFFWAFALFFLPNLLSLLLWLLFFFQSIKFDNGWLARSCLFVLKKTDKYFNKELIKESNYWPLFGYYFKLYFGAALGRYQLSFFSHLLWLSYFGGALLMLLVMLATHQVDFVWQTSILSAQSFQWLTELLAYIPNLIGLPVPDSEQIQHANIGGVTLLADAENARLAWSSLLISSLFIYGLIPRLLLMLWMKLLLNIKTNKYQLNFSIPYYVQLRQILKPPVTLIVDPDNSAANNPSSISYEKQGSALPDVFFPVALELSDTQLTQVAKHIKLVSPAKLHLMQHVSDYQSQQKLDSTINTVKEPAIVIYVALQRVPDRGVQRFLKSLTAKSTKTCYLLLVNDLKIEPAQQITRRDAWYSLAAQVNIPLDNIIQLDSLSEQNEA
ncbi:DUF2868 domain-containing protein [Psychromonas sp.]|uniref:DUF2868 domain-containing protein n=1 Tax=Psychromonas sp. TaxID=1884585 RepID=UPI003568044F